jgi:hypothetical protein
MTTIHCLVYVDEATGRVEGVHTPTANMPEEGLHEDIGKRLIKLTEANLPEEKCKEWGYFQMNYWFNKTTMTFEKVGLRPNDFATYDFSTNSWTWPREEILELIRRERNGRLLVTDWTQISDNSLTDSQREQVRVYRQELRDMMTSVGNPATLADVSWPTPPDIF